MMMAGSLLMRDTSGSSPVKHPDHDENDEGNSDPRVELMSASGNSCNSVILLDYAAEDHAYYYDEVVYVSDDYMDED